jgi:hypothetical protein
MIGAIVFLAVIAMLCSDEHATMMILFLAIAGIALVSLAGG